MAGHAGLFSAAADVHALVCRLRASALGQDAFLPADIVRRFWTRDGLVPDSTWALGWDTPSPTGSSAGARVSAQAVGHLGFTGTSLWIDFERDAHVIFLTNRVHPDRARTSASASVRPRLHDARVGSARRMRGAPDRRRCGVGMSALATLLREARARRQRLGRAGLPAGEHVLRDIGVTLSTGWEPRRLARCGPRHLRERGDPRQRRRRPAAREARPAHHVLPAGARGALPRRPAPAGRGRDARQDHVGVHARVRPGALRARSRLADRWCAAAICRRAPRSAAARGSSSRATSTTARTSTRSRSSCTTGPTRCC